MESYSGHHPESIEELLEWPYRRFIAAYSAWRRRKLSEEWEAKKTAHVMALHANTNMDIPENKKAERIKEIEESYDKVVDAINGEDIESNVDEMPEEQQAFMKAARRGQEMVAPPEMPGERAIANLPQ